MQLIYLGNIIFMTKCTSEIMWVTESIYSTKPTVHFRKNEVSDNSSWEFECVLDTSDTYSCPGGFCTHSTLPTRWHCNQFLQKSPKSESDNTFTLKEPFITPNFCKQNLSRIHCFEIVNSFTFKIAPV